MSTFDPSTRIPLPGSIPGDTGELDYILKANGALAQRWADFQPRESQLKMFRETLRAFRDADTTVIEAGTGTGKTLAYLLPAIISGKRTVVSTGLKNLQDQIYDKDLGFIRTHFDKPFTSAILKGRDNYVCMKRFDSVMRRQKMALTDPGQARWFEILREWKGSTVQGEIAELPLKLTKTPPFDKLRATHETCMGKKCPFKNTCFLQQARARAAESDIVLANHYLLMADLALQDNSANVLPQWDAAVFDEAHLLEQVAVSCFSQRLSLQDVQSACYDLASLLDRQLDILMNTGHGPSDTKVKNIMALKVKAENQLESAARIANPFQKGPGDKSDGEVSVEQLWPDAPEDRWPPDRVELKSMLWKLTADLTELEKQSAEFFSDEDEEYTPVRRRLEAAASTGSFIVAKSDPGFVYVIRAGEDDVVLSAMPIDVSAYLRDKLFNFRKTVIVTSATIASGNSLAYFNSRLGIDQRVKGLTLKSPFKYWDRTIMYIPSKMPEFDKADGNEKFRRALVDELAELLAATRGRALVLFTATRQMEWVYESISMKNLPWRLLKQGQENRSRLLEIFREDVNSVLLATMSFWQGVDVPGQSLSAVIIDKLPFPVPTDPLHSARCNLLKTGDPKHDKWAGFHELSVPEMEIKLKQGLGRLIRSASDFGLMAVLDPRLQSSGYGHRFLLSFEHGPIHTDISKVRDFFTRMEGPHPPAIN
ncbi:MAG: ATP-dependent DNA helicase [Deltaproteobacteria bacterium]|jgi:ATP-dependent DNA helicase DinG|nr:ATP-dependent DNA helicase [Deltaproteobacteria bacterium]